MPDKDYQFLVGLFLFGGIFIQGPKGDLLAIYIEDWIISNLGYFFFRGWIVVEI